MHLRKLYIHMPHIHTHTLHTCCSSKWYFLSSLMCAFAAFCWRKTSSCWRFSTCLRRSLGANFCWGRRKVSLGWQKHFGFGEENIVQGLCIYAEAVKQLIIHTKCWKILMVVCCMQSRSLKGGLLKVCPHPPGKFSEFRISGDSEYLALFGSLKAILLAIHISVS